MKSSVIRSTHSARVQDSSPASNSAGGPGGPRLTAEMCKAIKRQEVTAGMDYWKVGHDGIATHVHDKRPTYSRVTQINLDFPGAFLPSVNSLRQQKSKRKESNGLALNRSRTTLMPNITQTRVRPVKNNPSKKVTTELTCLQLADTLFASKNSAFAGFFNFALPKSNYLDYFGSDSDGSETDMNKLVQTNNVIIQKDQRNRSVNSAIKYRTLLPDDNKTTEDRDRLLYSPTSPVFPPRWNELFSGIKTDSKPQKSILKNGANKQNDAMESCVCTDSCRRETGSPSGYSCNSCSSTMRYQNGHVKLESITPVIQATGSPRYLSGKPGQAEVVVRLDNISNVIDTRKRSVRFNSDHEVREYKPCEPVSFC